jgi:zinc transporter, ZIP family
MICTGLSCILIALALILAGPLLGSLIGILIKPTKKVVSFSLGLAAGVMLAISFLQLIPASLKLGVIWISVVGFIDGFLLVMVMDLLLPHIHRSTGVIDGKSKMKRTAILITVGIALHNLPEGFAIASGMVSTLKLGLLIAVGIAFHDIPEAIASTVPMYAATRNRTKSFLISCLTAIPTLIGFLIGYFLFKNISAPILALIMSTTAGIMVYLTLDELVPTSKEQGHNHFASIGMMMGIILILLSNLL